MRKKNSDFNQFLDFLRKNHGKTVTSFQILQGHQPSSKDNFTSYLYKFIKLGYVEPINNGKVVDPNTLYSIIKEVPIFYNSVMMAKDLRMQRGEIASVN